MDRVGKIKERIDKWSEEVRIKGKFKFKWWGKKIINHISYIINHTSTLKRSYLRLTNHTETRWIDDL